ncbi:hypothetical protein G4B88_029626 [Cannabis sativa]|uniref:DUF1985 domain-containing protein n=1 Tax=Cannabis sativa TaxID=3483 RepID=A0A7J6FSI1_CANSA|nr:hypothetical protein G4B88_029626 [Cannabis sativa]
MIVTHGAIKQHFLSSTVKDDEFAVRMAVLYLVTNYLLSKPPDKHVSIGLLHLVGSSEFDSFPWGKVVYDTTLYYLRLGLKGKKGAKLKALAEAKGIDKKGSYSNFTPLFPSAEENEKFDLTGFNFSYFSLSDDDFESVRVPRRQLDKGEFLGNNEKVTVGGPMFNDVKDYVMHIINKQSDIGSSLKKLRKDINDKFLQFESKMKAHIDSKIEEGLVLYLDKKFSDLNDVLEGLKDCLTSQRYDDRNGGDGSDDSGGGEDDGSEGGDRGDECDGGDGGDDSAVDVLVGVKDDGAEVYKEIRQISDVIVNQVADQVGDRGFEDCMDK